MPGEREEAQKDRHIGRWICILSVFALLMWVPAELFLSANVPRLEYLTLSDQTLPSSFDGLRILHLSDLHEKSFGQDNVLLLKLARDAKPDIIAVTGDLIQSPEGLPYAGQLLPELTAIAPVYYVTGNHEWAADNSSTRLIARLRGIVADSGAVWLDSSFLRIERGGESIVLAGVCDRNGPRNEPVITELYRDIRDAYGDAFTVLLNHRHDAPYAGTGYGLVLAGHAHGGVVRLPFTDGLIGPAREWFPQGTSGIVYFGGTPVVVSRGLGDTYFPRFLNRPQALAVTLRAEP